MRCLIGFTVLGMIACASYAQSPTDGIYPDVIEHPIPKDLSRFKQPTSLLEDMRKIQSGSLKDRIKALAGKSRRDQVFVRGGTFQMGDFGRLQSEEKLPWDGKSDSSPLHEVTLDSYSISRYKVTLAEFDLYAEANKVPSVQIDEIHTMSLGEQPPYRSVLDRPAGTTWHQAKAYCQWLGKLTKQAFDLPTEAQWEYAARDRGKFIVYPTNNGKAEWNKNIAGHDKDDRLNQQPWGEAPYSIARFPPSPLGLYDLAENGLEWVHDWYAEDWYQHSDKARNPTGPETGEEKVQRARTAGFGRTSMTMLRHHEKPGPQTRPSGEPKSTTGNGFRCAVHTTRALKNN